MEDFNTNDLHKIMYHIGSIERHLEIIKDYTRNRWIGVMPPEPAKQCIVTCNYPNNPELDSHRCTGKAHRFGKCKECLGLEHNYE